MCQVVKLSMSQIIRIQSRVLHIPSIARTRLSTTTILGRPLIKIVYHDGNECILYYRPSQWFQATNDYKRLEASRKICYEALKEIPLLEEDLNPLVESERKMR